MNITMDEDHQVLRVESGGKLILELSEFPVQELKEQLRAWLAIVDDHQASSFIFRPTDPSGEECRGARMRFA